MTEKQTTTFLVTIFPTIKEEKSRIELAKRVALALRAVCPNQVAQVHPDESKLVLLVQGDFSVIVKALDGACQQHDDRWLLAQVGTPCAANGLSAADGWIRSHSPGAKK